MIKIFEIILEYAYPIFAILVIMPKTNVKNIALQILSSFFILVVIETPFKLIDQLFLGQIILFVLTILFRKKLKYIYDKINYDFWHKNNILYMLPSITICFSVVIFNVIINAYRGG